MPNPFELLKAKVSIGQARVELLNRKTALGNSRRQLFNDMGVIDFGQSIVAKYSEWAPVSIPTSAEALTFLKEKNPKINFVHMDVDTYESSKFVLESIKPNLVKGSVILFDELYNFEVMYG